MRTLSACILILGAVACRGRDERHTVPTAEPQTTVAAPPIDPTPSRAAPETLPAAASAVASSSASGVPSSERPAGAAARSSNTPRPSASAAANEAPAPSAPSPSAATKAAEVRPKRGGAAIGPSYEVWLETTGGYAPGASATVLVVVNAKPPYKCNAQYPYKFVLDAPPPGVSYPSATVRGMHVDGKHASMSVPFVATDAGSHAVGGTLSFSTCTEDKCLVDKAHLSVVVEVR